MKFFSIFLVYLLIYNESCFCQDSINIKRNDEEVIIIATRTPIKIGNIAMPILVLNKNKIVATGATKLNEVLQENTGIFITSGNGSKSVGGGVFGNGLQMQGLSAEHTLILIDGEAVNGRQGGVLDLSRIAVGNIKRIEIIKGPFSSLYGSEAMGGVVNIITENAKENSAEFIIKYGSFNTIDAQSKLFLIKKKWENYFFINAASSNGYDLNKNDIEKTLDPYKNISFENKLKYTINGKSYIQITSRIFYGIQNNDFSINTNYINIVGKAKTLDFANTLKFVKNINSKATNNFTIYQNTYKYNQNLDSVANQKNYYSDFFTQHLLKAENIINLKWKNNFASIFGLGYTYQQIETNRYSSIKTQNAIHLFMQNELQLKNKLNISAGIRIDKNNAYENSINPKLAVLYKLNKLFAVNASIGSGFKAPDFRQLYLNFINNAANGYEIYGANEFSLSDLNVQKNNGLISAILPAAYSIKKLEPEKNVGFNLGIHYSFNKLKSSINFFKNDISNLIQYVEVAKRYNGSSVFSYMNISKSLTKGFEFNNDYKINKSFNIQLGYQYLISADKDILQNIKYGKVYGRDAVAAPARIMTKNDYYGLQFRSKHSANIKLNYTNNNFETSVRCIYRNKWGVTDLDGNGFANMPEEFAKGFLQINFSAMKKLNDHFNVQIGANNLTNYTDANYLSNIPPINFYTTISYKF